jgi:hypothetical protein
MEAMTEVLMTLPFKRRFKDLSKRYRKIQADIQPIVEALESGEIIGDSPEGEATPTNCWH